MLEVKLYELDFNKIPECTRVICVSKYKDKWVFCKQKGKETWEILVNILKKEKIG